MKRASSVGKQSNSKMSTTNSMKYQNIKSKYKEPKKIIGATNFDQTNSSGKLAVLPQSTIRLILQFSIQNFEEYVSIKQVCLRFYYELKQNVRLFQYLNVNNYQSINEIVNHLKVNHFYNLIQKYANFQEKMNSLFQYGATKLNLPDKLLESLKLSVQCTVNKKIFYPTLLFRKLNFASHLYFKIMLDTIPINMKKDTYDQIKISITINSKSLNLIKKFEKQYECQEIIKKSITQKAFNYMTDGRYLFTYFENDKQILYFVWEHSSIDLMHYFWTQLKKKYFWINKQQIEKQYKNNQLLLSKQCKIRTQSVQDEQSQVQQQQKLDQNDSDDDKMPFQLQKQDQLILPQINRTQQQQQQLPPKQKKKVSTFLKTKMIQNKIQYQSMKEYMYDQQDFELMINIHTGIKGQNLFYFVDTKAMPKLDNQYLYFTYKMKEHINLSYKLYLDNKMGMKEVIDNLYLCDITFKDRDEFRILFSGFVQMYEEDTQTISKEYDVSYLDIKEWRSLKLIDENRFELIVLFGTIPSVIKLLQLKLININ